jgi:hypothetical protein
MVFTISRLKWDGTVNNSEHLLIQILKTSKYRFMGFSYQPEITITKPETYWKRFNHNQEFYYDDGN